jgi:hypothetical protein
MRAWLLRLRLRWAERTAGWLAVTQMQMNAADFVTSDIHLAAYLLATDHPLRRLNGSPGQRAFVFGNVTEQDVQRFYAGAPSDARKVLGALRDLVVLLAEGDRR